MLCCIQINNKQPPPTPQPLPDFQKDFQNYIQNPKVPESKLPRSQDPKLPSSNATIIQSFKALKQFYFTQKPLNSSLTHHLSVYNRGGRGGKKCHGMNSSTYIHEDTYFRDSLTSRRAMTNVSNLHRSPLDLSS